MADRHRSSGLQGDDQMTEIFIRLGEAATNRWVDMLLEIGRTIPGDRCECIYVEAFGLVIQLFA